MTLILLPPCIFHLVIKLSDYFKTFLFTKKESPLFQIVIKSMTDHEKEQTGSFCSIGGQKVIRDSLCSHYATRDVTPQFPLPRLTAQ